MLNRSIVLLASLTLLPLATSASAQDALGDGRALDANLSTTGRGNPARAEPDYDRRNRLVTGNVLGGRGFRGTVGYSATDAFRAETGSDDLYGFRTDSGFSDVNFATYSHTLNRLRFGQGLGLVGVPAATSTSSIATAVSGAPGSIESTISSRIQLDRMNFVNSLSAEAASGAEPFIVGGFLDEEGDAQFLQTSSLTGIVTVPTERLTTVLGLSRLDHARLNDDVLRQRTLPSAIGSPYDERYVDLAQDVERLGTSASDPIGNPVDADERDSLDTLQAIRERVAARAIELGRAEDPAADDEDILNNLDEALRRLREELLGADPTGEDPDADPERGPQDPEPVLPKPALDPTVPLENVMRPVPHPSVLAAIRDGVTIDRLAAPTETRLEQLIAEAQTLLEEGRYLSAERRFSRALRFKPRHPLASTGLLLAQLGAGVYTSAGLTLRELYIGRPEMMGAQIDPSLHPAEERLAVAESTLRQRLALESRPDEALLLAFLGHLRNDDDLIREGLRAANATRPEDGLVPILRELWLGERP